MNQKEILYGNIVPETMGYVSTLISERVFLKKSIWFLPSQYRGATFIVFEEEKMNKKRTKITTNMINNL